MAAPPVARCLPFPGPGPNAVPIAPELFRTIK